MHVTFAEHCRHLLCSRLLFFLNRLDVIHHHYFAKANVGQHTDATAAAPGLKTGQQRLSFLKTHQSRAWERYE